MVDPEIAFREYSVDYRAKAAPSLFAGGRAVAFGRGGFVCQSRHAGSV
jgi:hypothetical protein